MKKYVKPELVYEKFELSQHIADCAWELTNFTKDTCSAEADPDYLKPYYDLGYKLFMSGPSCVLIPQSEPNGNYSDYCYHDGAQGVNVFAS